MSNENLEQISKKDLEVIDEQLARGYGQTMDKLDDESDGYVASYRMEELHDIRDEMYHLNELFKRLNLVEAGKQLDIYHKKVDDILDPQGKD